MSLCTQIHLACLFPSSELSPVLRLLRDSLCKCWQNVSSDDVHAQTQKRVRGFSQPWSAPSIITYFSLLFHPCLTRLNLHSNLLHWCKSCYKETKQKENYKVFLNTIQEVKQLEPSPKCSTSPQIFFLNDCSYFACPPSLQPCGPTLSLL